MTTTIAEKWHGSTLRNRYVVDFGAAVMTTEEMVVNTARLVDLELTRSGQRRIGAGEG